MQISPISVHFIQLFRVSQLSPERTDTGQVAVCVCVRVSPFSPTLCELGLQESCHANSTE